MSVKSQKHTLKKIRLGTRGSPLALVQAEMVRSELAKIDPLLEVSVLIIKTSGDWKPEQGEVKLEDLSGRKGMFSKELESALLNNEIDAAVHSMKDMEVDIPDDLKIPFMLPREDVRDIFISNISQNIEDLPNGSVFGSVSARRTAYMLAMRPDLKIQPLRGNVHTRIQKLKAGQVDATLLAAAGLKRLNLIDGAKSYVSLEKILPAVGQGAIGIEVRKDDLLDLSIFGQISCEKTVECVNIERAVLKALGGSCHTPVGVYAEQVKESIRLRACLLSPDGRSSVSVDKVINRSDFDIMENTATEIGNYLRANAPEGSL